MDGSNHIYASIVRRFFAFLIDLVVLIIPGIIIAFVAVVIGDTVMIILKHGQTLTQEGMLLTFKTVRLFVFFAEGILAWIYSTSFETFPAQATLGKKVVGIMVIDHLGNPITTARAHVRFMGKAGCLLIVGCSIGLVVGLTGGLTESAMTAVKSAGIILFLIAFAVFASGAFTRTKQTLYDRIAGTFVVRK